MPKRKPDLSAMTPEEASKWAQGRSIAEVIDAMGAVPEDKVAVVSFIPKNGRFNRCSICRTNITHRNGVGHPMEVTVLGGGTLRVAAVVCSDPNCVRRLHERHS